MKPSLQCSQKVLTQMCWSKPTDERLVNITTQAHHTTPPAPSPLHPSPHFKNSHYCGTLLLPWAFSTRGTGGRRSNPSLKTKKAEGADKHFQPFTHQYPCLMLTKPPYGPVIIFMPPLHTHTQKKISIWPPRLFSCSGGKPRWIKSDGQVAVQPVAGFSEQTGSGLLESPHTASHLSPHTHSHLLCWLKDYKGRQRDYLKERRTKKKEWKRRRLHVRCIKCDVILCLLFFCKTLRSYTVSCEAR